MWNASLYFIALVRLLLRFQHDKWIGSLINYSVIKVEQESAEVVELFFV